MERAYVTLICGGDSYVPGVEALGRSLRASGTREPLLVMATPDVPAAATASLESAGWEVCPVDPIKNPLADGALLYSRFRNVYTKLRVFGLTRVKKVVFLDADTLVLRNVDELFERPHFAAAPDFFMPDQFNSGVMVLEPSAEIIARMDKALETGSTYDGGDQGFLNQFFADWWSMPAAHRLPSRYNVHHFIFQFMAAHRSLKRQFLDEVRIVHYTLQKPWLQATLTGGARMWWDRYLEGHPEEDTKWRRRLHGLEDWTFDSLISVLGGG